MRKANFMVLVAAMLVMATAFSWAQSVTPAVFTATVTGGALHLREAPDTSSLSLKRYPSGTRVTVLADGVVYCRVQAPDLREGYMMKEYLVFENGLPPMEAITPSPAPTPDMTRAQALSRGIDPTKPMLALTFDDGPAPETGRVLDALDQHGARGTFFILGKNIEGNEEIIKRAALGGHQLAAHSWSHPNFNDISDSAITSQMQRTMDKIFELTGQQVTMVRTPFGASNRVSRRPLAKMGLPLILWSVDSLDWSTRSVSKTIRAIRKGAENGAIILCHDVWDSTGQAMETIVPELISKGYQLVTVAEMMSFRDEPLKPGWEYSFLDISRIEPGLTPLPQALETPVP